MGMVTQIEGLGCSALMIADQEGHRNRKRECHRATQKTRRGRHTHPSFPDTQPYKPLLLIFFQTQASGKKRRSETKKERNDEGREGWRGSKPHPVA